MCDWVCGGDGVYGVYGVVVCDWVCGGDGVCGVSSVAVCGVEVVDDCAVCCVRGVEKWMRFRRWNAPETF